MKIHRNLAAVLDAGDSRAYIASDTGFLKSVKVGTPDKPIHGLFVAKIERPKDLETVQPQIVLFDFVPVPAPILARATAIFRHVYDNYDKAEMIVLLRWKEVDLGNGRKVGRYYLDRADRVEVAAGGLDYKQSVPIVGSIHSHGSFGAGFSPTDDRWERDDTPGIYITIGNVNSPSPSIETSIGGLGVRKVVPSPKIPPEVMNAAKLSEAELKWWTETLSVKQYSRSNGFYICLGNCVTGWAKDEKAHLATGEKIVPVSEFHQKQKSSLPPPGRRVWRPRYLQGDLPLARTTTRAEESGFTWKQFKRVDNFIKFLLKHERIQEFVFLLLQEIDDSDLNEVSNLIDMELENRLDDEKDKDEWIGSPFLGAGGSGTTLGNPLDDFWRR